MPILVTAPCRLHFGLFSFGNAARRQYGGVGAIIDQPRLSLRISQSAHFTATGPFVERVREFASRWSQWHQLAHEPACTIEVMSAPRMHVGLGVGTQLGLAIAAGLNAITEAPSVTPSELAGSVGRGQRSAIGTFGFLQGGLIVEEGKLPSETLAPLLRRTPLPDEWRFVLITPNEARGLSGQREHEAFRQLPPVPADVTEALMQEAQQTMVPAAREQHFESFCHSLHRYGRLAGSCFESIQGGPYNGQALEELVNNLTVAGYQGVGQSSWGPTVFVLTPDESAARELVRRVRDWPELTDAEIVISAANNCGASITREAG